MTMKKRYLFRSALLAWVLVALCSCDDFFDPENNTVKFGDDYMSERSELYSGFVGLVTKLQAVGDKAIYLTDTRAELLEPGGNSPEILNIYNYDDDLSGNSYADPAKYYDLVIACNDYLHKAKIYKDGRPAAIDMDHYRGLIGGTLRLKAWTYLTLAKIYGKAIWFDDPMWKLEDLSDVPELDLEAIVDKCDELLETGFDGVDGRSEMSWTEWIAQADDENVSEGAFYFWDLMVPPYFVLSAELSLWKGENYQKVVDLILPKLNEAFLASDPKGSQTKWMMSAGYNNAMNRLFDNLGGPSTASAVAVIRYNYEKDQTNNLLKHFYNDYLLRPSEAGSLRYTDMDFNPRSAPTSIDTRYSQFISQDNAGKRYFHKYRKRSGSNRPNTRQDDVHIYLYRSSELYLMLIEAFNHLQRYPEMNALLNRGVDFYFPTGNVTWEGFTDQWTRGSGRAWPDYGVRGVVGGLPRTLRVSNTEANRKFNDIQILQEIILDQPGEGKTYPAMIRMARRYNDPNIIADLVCPKYEVVGKDAEIRAKILNGGYFVPWDLRKVASRN